MENIPPLWNSLVEKSNQTFLTVYPRQTVNLNGTDQYLKNIESTQIYRELIYDKIRLPSGLLRWCEVFDISNEKIKFGFSFAKISSQSVFDRVFQYKILTQILPTNKYLTQYKVWSHMLEKLVTF